jgi:hypothetical protein
MSVSSESESADVLASGIHATLSRGGERRESLHASATRKLARLRDLLLEGEPLSGSSLTLLTSAGINAMRLDDEDAHTSAVLLFVNLCVAAAKRGVAGTDEESPEEFFGTLKSLLESPGVADESEVAEWALARGVSLLADASMDTVRPYARAFFFSSVTVLQMRCLFSDTDFLSLGMQREGTSVEMIVNAADSEAGQVVMRDLYLSFVLPMKLVGVRRTLLVSREAAHAATQAHPLETQQGHHVAMQGAPSAWGQSDDVTKKTVAVLAGLACLLTREGPDPIRKCDAFGGRVVLPFLEPRPPRDRAAPRVALDRWNNRWSLFSLTANSPEVLASGIGLAGLEVCAVGMFQVCES